MGDKWNLKRVVAYDDVRRAHIASELVRDTSPDTPQNLRHFELSLLVQRPGEELERIPLIEGLDSKLMLSVSIAIQKALGHREGSIEEVATEKEMRLEKPQD